MENPSQGAAATATEQAAARLRSLHARYAAEKKHGAPAAQLAATQAELRIATYENQVRRLVAGQRVSMWAADRPLTRAERARLAWIMLTDNATEGEYPNPGEWTKAGRRLLMKVAGKDPKK